MNVHLLEEKDLEKGYQIYEECFEKNPVLFIMFLRSLESLGDDKKRIKYLMKYKSQFSDVFEFWNERRKARQAK